MNKLEELAVWQKCVSKVDAWFFFFFFPPAVTLVSHLTSLFLKWAQEKMTHLLHRSLWRMYLKKIKVCHKKQEILFLRSASTNLTLYCRCAWTTDAVSVDCLSVLYGLHSCALRFGGASVLSPAQRTAPPLPPAAPDISYQSHYSPQEVVQSFLHPANPHLHLSLIRPGETSNPCWSL